MLYDVVSDPENATAADVLEAYAAELAAVVERRGDETVVERTGLDPATVEAIRRRDVGDLRLVDAAAVLALEADATGEEIVHEVRDHLLMGMSTAILDVDTIAASLEADLTGQEVQQALEGRTRLTLAELAEIQALIERRKRG